jgi:hypothetical protein
MPNSAPEDRLSKKMVSVNSVLIKKSLGSVPIQNLIKQYCAVPVGVIVTVEDSGGRHLGSPHYPLEFRQELMLLVKAHCSPAGQEAKAGLPTPCLCQ